MVYHPLSGSYRLSKEDWDELTRNLGSVREYIVRIQREEISSSAADTPEVPNQQEHHVQFQKRDAEDEFDVSLTTEDIL